jgi:hypothetical protein
LQIINVLTINVCGPSVVSLDHLLTITSSFAVHLPLFHFQTYKFYLSFENSVCDDYVTEKYFNILKYNVIPVTFSGVNFSAIGAPPHSSINVLDFGSPKKLV